MANRIQSRVPCPSCEEFIIFKDRPQLEDKIRCPHCRVDLIVVEVDPIELDWEDYDEADDEDWDDDDFGMDDDDPDLD